MTTQSRPKVARPHAEAAHHAHGPGIRPTDQPARVNLKLIRHPSQRCALGVWPSSRRSAGPAARCSPATAAQPRMYVACARRRVRIRVRRRRALVDRLPVSAGDPGMRRIPPAISPPGHSKGRDPSYRDHGLLILFAARCALRGHSLADLGVQRPAGGALVPGRESPARTLSRRRLLRPRRSLNSPTRETEIGIGPARICAMTTTKGHAA